ncbi:MAG TPA: signal peptidase I [Candidatus Pacearchaeota archaeon]|nr:signal peptidase I [Candidatus Pacearchaeota archaeon]HPR80218.1 signal peptidase I [Candidatus Pacearchaeota archaeon]
MKIFEYLYNTILGIIIIVAILLILSTFSLVGDFKVLSVLSGSMEPAIHTGSIVVIKPFSDYKIGDIITFGKTGKNQIPTTHRIKEMQVNSGVPYYITKGDANDSADQALVSKSTVEGKVLFSVPFLGYVVDFIKKPIGFILIIIVPVFLIIGDQLMQIRKEIKKKKQEITL